MTDRRLRPRVCRHAYRCLIPAIVALAYLTPGSLRAESNTARVGETARASIQAFDKLFQGPHAGQRAVHAKGVLAEGTFEPSEAATQLSRAVHFQKPTPVIVRFSSFSGAPTTRDGDPNTNPIGMAVKFMLPDEGETDIVAHAYNGFPVSKPEDFVTFLLAKAAPDPAQLETFLASHPAARAFCERPSRAPTSYAADDYYGVNAFRFTNAAGVAVFGRYHIEPTAGASYLNAEALAGSAPDYLGEELAERLRREPAAFRLIVQLAEPGDSVTDGSVAWPSTRKTVTVGVIRLARLVPASEASDHLLFTPLALVGGIEPSDDPLLLARGRSYRLSYDRRQADAESPDRRP